MLKLTAIGSVGADAEVKKVNGKSVIQFSVAHSEKYTDSKGEKQESTTWVRCSKWADDGKTGVAEYIKKGTKVYVEGFPKVQTYTTKDGKQGASLELRVLQVELLGSKDSEPASQAPARPLGPAAADPAGDDLPF